jgi:hypothetical protein
VTPEDADALVSSLVEVLDESVARRFEAFHREHMSEYFPFFDRLLVASDGDVWIRRHPRPLDETHDWD